VKAVLLTTGFHDIIVKAYSVLISSTF